MQSQYRDALAVGALRAGFKENRDPHAVQALTKTQG